jgi:hypothetical protein
MEKKAKGDGAMGFFKKKKEAEKTVQEMLGEAIAKQRRTEGRTVRVGVFNPKNAPCAFLAKTDLGPALREDLGEEGAVLLYYVESEGELVFRLTFSYGEGSEEMKLIAECLDSIYIEEDEELILPGDITRIHTEYIVDETTRSSIPPTSISLRRAWRRRTLPAPPSPWWDTYSIG